jgi:hypothetical protein
VVSAVRLDRLFFRNYRCRIFGRLVRYPLEPFLVFVLTGCAIRLLLWFGLVLCLALLLKLLLLL